MRVLRHDNKATSDMTVEELKEVAFFYCIKDYRKIQIPFPNGEIKTIQQIIDEYEKQKTINS